MAYDFDKFQEDAITLPRNKARSNWAKFENPGDKVSGFIRDVFYRGDCNIQMIKKERGARGRQLQVRFTVGNIMVRAVELRYKQFQKFRGEYHVEKSIYFSKSTPVPSSNMLFRSECPKKSNRRSYPV